ncbi:glycosyltransferase family 4 protein [Thermococcus sp. MV11]|uniref:glycosyltransferase family 4 protein n=1 Tax=Thermococcus sp. MV11 TaxID=1638267 RepID=UPI001431CF32|nr:glycosyltransferase family 4 protein [Thermococcus sp. MV11]NJE03843.1 glycosyltransferase family 4 protein [Thermococcus sp. MV11]
MTIKTFKDKTLLVISPWFPDEHNTKIVGIFVKDQVAALGKYFKEIIVMSPRPHGIDRDLKNYSWGNIRVYYPRFFHIPVSYFRKRYPDNSAKAILKIIHREKIKVDLIHSHFTSAGIIGLRLKSVLNIPMVITVHENPEWFLREYHSGNETVYSAWKNANALIRVNKKDFELLKNFNNNVFYVPNGFDSSLFREVDKIIARKQLGIPIGKKIILNVANLVPIKGHEYLISAMERVVKARDDILLIIIGNGPLRHKLEKQIKILNLEHHVKLVGAKPHQEIPLWMNAADTFVLSSLKESFGVVVIEALAVGTPVVATVNGGSEQIITSKDYGLLAEPANAEDLAEKILIALEKEWDREKIRQYAKQFTWDNVAKKILEIYSCVIMEKEGKLCTPETIPML